MFDSNGVDKPIHQSCIYLESTNSLIDNQYAKETNFRKRLHSLLSQNFKLKQEITRLKNEAKNYQQEQRALKQHLKTVLDEMVGNDKIIQMLRNNEGEYQAAIKHLQNTLSEFKHQFQEQKQVVSRLLDHNKNLQAQNELLIQIKQKYLLDLSKLKIQFDSFKNQADSLIKENQYLSIENSKLLEQIEHLEEQIKTKRNNIEQYQRFVLEKLSNAKNNEQFHQNCKNNLANLQQKYIKYKQKACLYKRQRDQLLVNLQLLSRQFDGNTLRKYYDEG